MIRQGVEVPESQNDLRRMQLRELALLNGTLRESDGPRCSNCGSTAHRSWQCPDKPNVTNNVVCTNCGGIGHIARDCKEKKAQSGASNQSKIDEEYLSLMAELGEGPPPPKSSSNDGGFGPTIGLSVSQPKALLPPPPPPPQTTSSAHTPLLPTPNVSQQHSSWNRDNTQISAAIPPWTNQNMAANYNLSVAGANCYPHDDSYASQGQTSFSWLQGITYSFIS